MKQFVLASLLVVASYSSAAEKINALELAVSKFTGAPGTAFIKFNADLNGDSLPDALVLLQGNKWCGSGGCTLLILKGTSAGYSLISHNTISAAPIRILKSSHLGWKDLIVHSNGTGDVLLIYNHSKYPFNPSLQPKATIKQIHSSSELKPDAPN
ncbi:hypothetical protein [Solilutibacter silvestris]|uniref:hypothetical protein n=1 Tax=Solilutibacter silvestris TaxID=1645665 RepID=UPI003D34697C